MGTFKAGVQYDDWKGTAAADDLDRGSLRTILIDRGLIDEGDFPIAVEVWVGENGGGEPKPPVISVFVAEGMRGADTAKEFLERSADPLDLKKVELELSLTEFFGLFKRFSIVIGRRGLAIEDREYRE